jgi:hypothetical protein
MNRVRLTAAALLAVTAVLLPAGSGSALGGLPIPSLPTDFLSEPFSGTPATANPVPHETIKQNPYLSANGTNSMHNDAYASDAYEVSGPLGANLQVRSAWYGVSECATVAFDSQGRMVGLCGDLLGFRLRIIDPTTLRTIGTGLVTSQRNLASGANPFTDLCGGTYFSLDSHDVAYVLTVSKQIWKVRVDAAGFTKLGAFDLSATMPQDDCLIATLPDWSGRIFYVTKQGRVGVMNPSTGAVKTMKFPDGGGIFNSIAGDESGAIYIVTDRTFYAVDADATGQPQVRWAETYDRGTQQKSGQLSQGSGTTPTVIGDDLVVITDNAEPRMNVLFYDRRDGVADRLLCKVPVFAAGASATDNSLTYAGGTPDGPRSVIVENNYGYDGVQSTILGKSTAGGVAKVSINPDNSCQVDWTNPIVSPTPVPKASLGNGLIYLYAKPASNPLDDSWYFAAVDIRTGQTKWMQRTGNGIQWNNHYASIYLGPDGAAYMPTLTGMIRFKDQ